jgi:hypothetical protein
MALQQNSKEEHHHQLVVSLRGEEGDQSLYHDMDKAVVGGVSKEEAHNVEKCQKHAVGFVAICQAVKK